MFRNQSVSNVFMVIKYQKKAENSLGHLTILIQCQIIKHVRHHLMWRCHMHKHVIRGYWPMESNSQHIIRTRTQASLCHALSPKFE